MSLRQAPLLSLCAVGLGAGLMVAGCGEPQTGDVGQDRYQGELESMVATYPDGTSQTSYYLRGSDGSRTHLVLSGALDGEIAPGDPIELQGTRVGDDIRVEWLRTRMATGEIASRASALIGQAPKPARRMAFVLVDMQSGTATLTAAQAQEKLFTDTTAPDTSIAEYYVEDSYGIQTLTGTVFGPFTYPTLTTCTDMDMSTLANTLRPMVTGTFDQYGWYFLQNSVCTWGGLAQVGTAAKPAKDTWFDASSDCVVLVQEPGHNYGMTHSSALKCGTATLTDDLSTGCTHDEYGDPYDPMGKGCYHMNVYQKAYQGWLSGCNSVKVTASGTFDIFPTENACNAIQVLQVPMPKTRPFTRPAAGGGNGGTTNLAFYYVEYRQQAGNFEKPPRSGNVFSGVLIHAGEAYRTSAQQARYPYLLDMTPETTTMNDAALAVGKTFTDPAGGVSITLVSATATKATVQVTIDGGSGDPTCLDGTTVTAPGPQSCDVGGPTGGVGGSSGAGGTMTTTGTGGSRGTGGGTGSGGTPGTGSGGSRGTGGGTGSGGSRGTGGGTGSGGTPATGSGGAHGTGGATGSGGHDDPNPKGTGGNQTPSEIDSVTGGCSCDTTGSRGGAGLSSLVGLLLIAGVTARRRRRMGRN